MRRRQLVSVAGILLFFFCTYSLLKVGPGPSSSQENAQPQAARPLATKLPENHDDDEEEQIVTAPDAINHTIPKPFPDSTVHPVWSLIKDAKQDFDAIKKRQSQDLNSAVNEYRTRYGLPPPPHFDKWFHFARKHRVQLTDEYDTIYDLITPFWGLSPRTIRARTREALGKEQNGLIGVAIRNHEVTYVERGPEWQQLATKNMMEAFIQYLPDMDLAFNIHDEPRVMVPHDDLNRLVVKAKTETMAAANSSTQLKNHFASRAPDLNDGLSFQEFKTTRFNMYAHQPTWTHSRMSCPPDSPVRALDEEDRLDELDHYAVSDLGFIYNTSALADICFTPSLESSYGFFDRPNSYNVVHDLFPIFSQSKISSYGDIIYPSPWYWDTKVAIDKKKDMPWQEKQGSLYWRGSTTGGFSRDGGWRRQHRQHFVQKLNAGDEAQILVDNGQPTSPRWEVQKAPRGDFANLVDVHFSHIGQCDPEDCQAQEEFFELAEPKDQQDAWQYKYLLDVDGNAFSGRFQAFLLSESLTLKFAIFKEWHNEWLKPWLHYVPMSLRGDDWLEVLRFLNGTADGDRQAQKMASDSKDWALQALRKEDMQAWFFRLMLEYARVINDDRENLGFETQQSRWW